MKVLSRDFTFRERMMIFGMVIVLMVMAYFLLFDSYIRTGMDAANADSAMYQTQLLALEEKINQLEKMKQELATLTEENTRMPSYNASSEEISLLNKALADTVDYTIEFTSITRTGDQIRRGFTLDFVARDYEQTRSILETLSATELRCILGNMAYAENAVSARGADTGVQVVLSAVFYETMVGGTEDAGLPPDTQAATNTDTPA